jgi:hypothetical protein
VESADGQAEKWYSHQLTAEEFKVFVEEAKTGKIDNSVWIGNVETETANKI